MPTTSPTGDASTPQKTGFKPRPGRRLIPPLISIPIFMILLAGGIWLFLDARDKLDKLAQQQHEDNPGSDPEDYGDTPGHRLAAQRLASTLNTKVNPCDDFYEYSCGKWLKDNPIPDDLRVYDFHQKIRDEIESEMDKLLQSSAPTSSKAIEKVRLLYKTCLDKSAYQSEALKQALNAIRPWMNAVKESLAGQLFTVVMGNDLKNFDRRIVAFLPPQSIPLYRDVWLDKTKFKKEQDAYRQYLKSMFTTFAQDMNTPISGDLDKQIDDLFELYRGMAKTMAAPGEEQNVISLYNMEKFSSLVKHFKDKSGVDLMPIYEGFSSLPSWKAFIADPDLMVMIPYQRAVDEIAQLYHDTSTDTLISLVIASSLDVHSQNFPEKYLDMKLEMEKVVWGDKAKKPKWKRCAGLASQLTEAYSALYIRESINQTKATKKAVEKMAVDLKSAFSEIIDEADWIDETTKQAVKKKVKEMLVKIGYEDEELVLDDRKLDEIYEDFQLDSNTNFLDMAGQIGSFVGIRKLKKFFAPYDRKTNHNFLWEISATEVNALATATTNAIDIPAAIIRAPLFDHDNLAALNYGSTGTLLGHEITHHFDSRGRFFDETGLLNEYWATRTRKEYDPRAQCMIDQYSAVEVEGLDGIKAIGKMTIGEDISDNGGVREAFRAYQKYLAKNGREKLVPGYKLSNEQLFWIAYGQTWCANYREGALKHWTLTDDHSPGKPRINVVVSNQPEFAKAFKCPKGSPMNPEKKCTVW